MSLLCQRQLGSVALNDSNRLLYSIDSHCEGDGLTTLCYYSCQMVCLVISVWQNLNNPPNMLGQASVIFVREQKHLSFLTPQHPLVLAKRVLFIRIVPAIHNHCYLILQSITFWVSTSLNYHYTQANMWVQIQNFALHSIFRKFTSKLRMRMREQFWPIKFQSKFTAASFGRNPPSSVYMLQNLQKQHYLPV